MTSETTDHNKIATEALNFRDTFQSLQLATVSETGQPLASYAPYVLLNKSTFGIFISRLAKHTHHLLNTPHASVIFIEPESSAQNIFARRRLIYHCIAHSQPRDSTRCSEVISAMEQRFGPVVKQLEQLADFEAFTLEMTQADYIVGFGKAYRFENGNLTNPSLITG